MTSSMPRKAGAMSLALLFLGITVASCSGGSDGTAGADGGADGTSAGGGACTTDADCTAQLPATEPPNCAVAKCDALQKQCTFTAKDADGDGHTAANCKAAGSGSIQAGDDCDDADANLYPGHPETCSAKADGTTITWPTGVATGICKTGAITCQPDGTKSACTGAVAPGTRSCTSAQDNDCDGKVDSSECGCALTPSPATQSCFTFAAPAQAGNGPCKSGSQTCVATADGTNTTWGDCIGQTGPAGADTCNSASTIDSDNNCNGVKNEGCSVCAVGGANNTASCDTCGTGTKTCLGGPAPGAYASCTNPPGYCEPAAPLACQTCSTLTGFAQGPSDGTEICQPVTSATKCSYTNSPCTINMNIHSTLSESNFQHQCGSANFSAWDVKGNCLAQYGPGVTLPPGNYQLSVDALCTSAEFTLEIWENGIQRHKASYSCGATVNQSWPLIAFSLTACTTDVEFRVNTTMVGSGEVEIFSTDLVSQ